MSFSVGFIYECQNNSKLIPYMLHAVTNCLLVYPIGAFFFLRFYLSSRSLSVCFLCMLAGSNDLRWKSCCYVKFSPRSRELSGGVNFELAPNFT